MHKKEKKGWKIYYSLHSFREDTSQKQLTNHNARNHEPAETEYLSGGLCEHQDLPYSH